jgi:formylglycine-generating enzyme required for sulfatase activity
MIRQELDRTEGKPDRLLLYIDQWEELYAQAPSSSDRERAAQHSADVNRFIDLLLNASRCGPVTVVATVRADFYDPLISHQGIRSLLPTRQVTLGKMSLSDLECTIVEPAKKVGLTFDPPSLVQRILDEAGEDEGMLPLLQYALKETWALRKGNAMSGDSYMRSGGVREAIRLTAERTFDTLSPEDQQAARQLFLRLVTPSEGQEDTRARAAMPSEPVLRKIVERFAGPRTRLLVTGSDRASRPTVEVAHEALIRTWPRLRGWIDANREKLRSRAAVLQAKIDWEQNGRRDDLLLAAGFQLERARELLVDPNDITIDDLQEFIMLSSTHEEAERKKAQRLRRIVIGSMFTVLVGVILGLVGWINQGYLKEQINWYWTMRPYRVANIDPYVLKPEAERALNPGDSFRECANDCPEMIVVPAGELMMGSPTTEEGRYDDEGPQHRVTIGHPFAVSKFDVTFADWDACVSVGGCVKVEVRASDADWGSSKQPVIYVSWDDAKAYAAWLSMMTGKTYRLLSEAEWEYAERAGTTTAYYWGDDIGEANANCDSCGSQWDGRQPSPVGSFKPNAFGLYDMAGNVGQWVEDCYRPDYDGAPIDGSAWIGGECDFRIVRGGSWNLDPQYLRSAVRNSFRLVNRGNNVGFRLGRTLLPQAPEPKVQAPPAFTPAHRGYLAPALPKSANG